MPPQQIHPQQIQPQLQTPAQVAYQDQHHFPGQTPSRREKFTDASTHGRDEKPRHKHKSREPSRQGSSYQGSENGAPSEVGVHTASHSTAHSSMTRKVRKYIDGLPSHRDGTPSPPLSVSDASDYWSESERSESSARTLRAHPQMSGWPSRAYQPSMRPSSATTSSAASSSEDGGDDERSESDYTFCQPASTWHDSPSRGLEANLFGSGDNSIRMDWEQYAIEQVPGLLKLEIDAVKVFLNNIMFDSTQKAYLQMCYDSIDEATMRLQNHFAVRKWPSQKYPVRTRY